MKKILTLFLLLGLVVSGYSQDKRQFQVSKAIENGTFVLNGPVVYGNEIRGTYPNGTVIPGTDSYFDHVTNGQNCANMWAIGDTMIVAYFGADMSDPTGTTSRVAYYIVSYDKGATWGTPLALTTLPRRSAYPFLVPYIGTLGRSIGFSGRLYTPPGPGSTAGGAYTDAFFGLGSITSVNNPNSNRDYFTASIGGELMGGIAAIAGSVSDTLNFWKFDMSTNTFTATAPVVVEGVDPIDVSSRWQFASTPSGSHMSAMWWMSLAGSEQDYYKSSTDGGATWSSATSFMPWGTILGGDSVETYLSMDIEYKPGTNDVYAVFPTLAPGSFLTTTGSKIVISSPALNSGNAVVIADRNNLGSILNDDSINTIVDLQVGVVGVSHPTIGWNDAGTMICLFSGYQPNDTMDLFNFNDIYYSLSYNGGMTWSDPVNLTNTDDWDELYPTVAPSGNTNEFFVHYQATRGPGSQSFSDGAPTYVVHQIFDIIPTSGIQNISSEIPDGFSLKQNYPNPFNPSTSIQFNISTSSLVSLKVYDITGREVATLVNNQKLSAGSFQYDFNASNLASGMYFYTLTAGDFKETKKMALIK